MTNKILTLWEETEAAWEQARGTMNPTLYTALKRYAVNSRTGCGYDYLRRGQRFDQFWLDMSNPRDRDLGSLYDSGCYHCAIHEMGTSALIATGVNAKGVILDFVGRYYPTDAATVLKLLNLKAAN